MEPPKSKSNLNKLRERAEYQIKQSAGSVSHKISLLNGNGLSDSSSEDKILKLIHELEVNQIELEMQNEELLLAQRQREIDYDKYVELYDFAPLGYFTLTPDGEIIQLNLNGAGMLRKERLILPGQKFSSFVSGGTTAAFHLFLERVFSSQIKEVCEVTLYKKGKVPIYALLSGISSGDEQNCFVTAVDITEKKISEINLLNSEGRFKNLIQDMTVGILLQGPSQEILLCNPEAIRLLGLAEDRLLGKTTFDQSLKFVHEDGSPFPARTLPVQRAIATKQPVREVVMGVCCPVTGEVVWLLMDALPQLNEFGGLQHVICSFIDITKLKEAEDSLNHWLGELESIVNERTNELVISNAELRVAREKYRTVADYTNDWETWIGADGNYIYVSPYCLLVTGYSAEEFLIDPDLFFRIVHPDDLNWVKEHYSEELAHEISSYAKDFRIIHKSGEERWISHRCQSVFDSEGKWNGQRSSNTDISERKRVESAIIASQQQLRALSQNLNAVAEEERIRIAREIHDELGHLLTALKFDIECITEKADLTTESITEKMDPILSMVDALIDSVRKIASELRPGILDHFGLFPAIEWQINQFQMRTRIKCTYELKAQTNLDDKETNNIYRILQEILTNVARHSKAENLWITIDQEDDLFTMRVADNGVGFEWANNFFTNSLGLMGMRERALSIGGELGIESEIGKGTTVIFTLNVK